MGFKQQLPKWLTSQCLPNQSLSEASRPHFYNSIPKKAPDTSLESQFNFWDFYSSKLFSLNLLKSLGIISKVDYGPSFKWQRQIKPQTNPSGNLQRLSKSSLYITEY